MRLLQVNSMDFIAARYFVYCGICTSSTVGWLYCKFYEFYFVSYYFKIFKYYIYLVHNCYFVYGIIVLCYNNKHKDHFLNSNFIFSVLVETHSTLQTGKAHLEKKKHHSNISLQFNSPILKWEYDFGGK